MTCPRCGLALEGGVCGRCAELVRKKRERERAYRQKLKEEAEGVGHYDLGKFALRTRAEVAQMMGVSRGVVFRLERSAIARIRRMIQVVESAPPARQRVGQSVVVLERHERQVARWRRMLVRFMRRECHQLPVRELILALAECELALERARAEIGL